MTEWQVARESARADFIDRMERNGFDSASTEEGHLLRGRLDVADTAHSLRILLNERFPFYPPKVYPDASLSRSWHRELDGAMCLYGDDNRDGLPWLDVDDFLALVVRWLEQTATGWVDDAPDLDLERYFLPADDQRLVTYGDLGPLVGTYVRMTAKRHTIEVAGRGSIPTRPARKGNRLFGYVINLGEPTSPPASWDQMMEAVPEMTARALGRAVEEQRITMLLLRYVRHGREAIVAVEPIRGRDGIVLYAHPSASTRQETLTMRAGPDAAALREKRVCVIGAGAIGSFLCDSLVRAGVGNLSIRDGDTVRPGNLVRHLADPSQVGLNKALAVAALLRQRPYSTGQILSIPTALTDPDEIPDVLAQFDLVIDATADASVTEMLTVGAVTLHRRFLSACIQQEGAAVRVDVIPPLQGAPLPAIATPTKDPEEEPFFEGGCGNPVSRTPPHAVMEAAALAARHAIGLLTGLPVNPTGTAHIYNGSHE